MNMAANFREQYETQWPIASKTYSNRWGWHFSQQPYVSRRVSLPSMLYKPTQNRPYKMGGSSEMYKKLYPGNMFSNAFVNDMGDL